jgi:hypothetical protein
VRQDGIFPQLHPFVGVGRSLSPLNSLHGVVVPGLGKLPNLQELYHAWRIRRRPSQRNSTSRRISLAT